MIAAPDLLTVDGLPLHPLVVHAVVVLLPLSAVGAVLIAVRPAWRRRYGLLVALLTLVAVAAVPIAQQTGKQLHHRLSFLNNPLIEQHAELGEMLLPWAIGFGVLVLALVCTGRLADRPARNVSSAGPASNVGRAERSGPWRVLVLVLGALVVLSAAATTTQVVRVGHSGSTAVWQGVGG